MPEFLDHVAHSGAAVDFVTTHVYGVDGGFLDENGGLTPDQVGQLQALTRGLPETERTVTVGSNGAFDVTVPMRANDVVLVTLARTQGDK